MIHYGSICSGIEAASVAWHGLGFAPQWFSEVAPFPSAVLARRFPKVPNRGDFTTIDDTDGIDLLVGGTPCQDFSVAGLRAGIAGERGNLTLEYVRLAGRARPRWLLWENVPGVLSVDGGRAFGAFLGGLAELGYGFAYRVLDAQFLGVPQRRRRVFVVGYLGDWRRAAAVLFERHSLSWDSPPRRETGNGVASAIGAQSAGGRGWRTGADEAAGGQVVAALTGSGVGASGPDDNQAQAGHFVTHGPDVSPALKARDRKGPSSDGDGDGDGAPLIAHSLRGVGFDASEDGTGRGTPIVSTAYRTSPNCGAWSTGDRVDALTTGTDPTSHVIGLEPLQVHGYNSAHASPQEADSREVLRALRQEVGEEAFTQWGLGILDSLHAATLLQSAMLGGGASRTEEGRGEVDDRSPSRAVHLPAGAMCEVRQAGRERRTPQEWRLAGQLATELGAYLSRLSHEGASRAGCLSGLWQGSEGIGVLRQALSAIREVGESAHNKAQSAQSRSGVRRLTPREAERLQGFPDEWTAIPYRGKPAVDGPRYEALGNSMAVPCMRWIGERIAMVESEGAAARRLLEALR